MCVCVFAEDERHSASVTFSEVTSDSSNHNTTITDQILTLEDLKPFQNPEQALRDCQQNLSDSDWYVVCPYGACVCDVSHMYVFAIDHL